MSMVHVAGMNGRIDPMDCSPACMTDAQLRAAKTWGDTTRARHLVTCPKCIRLITAAGGPGLRRSRISAAARVESCA